MEIVCRTRVKPNHKFWFQFSTEVVCVSILTSSLAFTASRRQIEVKIIELRWKICQKLKNLPFNDVTTDIFCRHREKIKEKWNYEVVFIFVRTNQQWLTFYGNRLQHVIYATFMTGTISPTLPNEPFSLCSTHRHISHLRNEQTTQAFYVILLTAI